VRQADDGGLEVEDVASVAPPFTGVVVATIAAVAPHPDADRLRVCTVDAGTGAPLQIVCGAPNAAAGMRVACAIEGATLPGGHTIRRTTMRGVESQGMLCSARELGLSDDAAGLVGCRAKWSRTRLARSARARRRADHDQGNAESPDCLSIVGVAREVSAITTAPLASPPHRA
jgi:phenylalanyl-tRNA synthetase beta chain